MRISVAGTHDVCKECERRHLQRKLLSDHAKISVIWQSSVKVLQSNNSLSENVIATSQRPIAKYTYLGHNIDGHILGSDFFTQLHLYIVIVLLLFCEDKCVNVFWRLRPQLQQANPHL